jgi:hypothetical protein
LAQPNADLFQGLQFLCGLDSFRDALNAQSLSDLQDTATMVRREADPSMPTLDSTSPAD